MRLITALFVFLTLLLSPAAYAQNSGIGDIIEDIFGGQTQYPAPRYPQAEIDNIPVAIFNEDRRDLSGHILIVTAYAAPPPNVRLSKPQFLGETRILMTTLGNPLEIIVAAPAQVTQGIEAARLAARVIDENGSLVLKSRDDSYYRGQAPAELYLVPASGKSTPPMPTSASKINLLGTAALPKASTPLPRGGQLHVILSEATSPFRILAENKINIDQKTTPFPFTLEHPDLKGQPSGKYVLSATIIDWAGRKTHITPMPETYIGPSKSYLLNLAESNELAGSPASPTLKSSSLHTVSGVAIFDAYKGLPRGSKMFVTVRNAANSDQIMATQTVELDGLSGPVKFSLPLPSHSQDQLLPHVDIRITDSKNMTLFAGKAPSPMSNFVSVRLRTDPRY